MVLFRFAEEQTLADEEFWGI